MASILWTDVVNPAEVTGYARSVMDEYEAKEGTLARWLPNRFVADIAVRVLIGSDVLTQVANFRAYDAAPEIGQRKPAKRLILELPAIGMTIPVGEYTTLRTRNAMDSTVKDQILETTSTVVTAVVNRIEAVRGEVLMTGKATSLGVDDFGRDAAHTATASALFSDPNTDILGQLSDISDLMRLANGFRPETLVVSTRIQRAIQHSKQFKTMLLDGSSRPATLSDMNSILAGANLPTLTVFDRRVGNGGAQRVVADDTILFLPAPVAPDAWQDTELGATFWGQTLTSELPSWGIGASDQPGLVAGVYRNEAPPVISEVTADAIALPVLMKANQSFALKVL